MHGQAETSVVPRMTWVGAHLVLFAIAAWWLAGGVEAVTGAPAGDPLRRIVLVTFGAVLWVRMTLTAMVLLRRRLGWQEAGGVIAAVALYQLGFAWAGAGQTASIGPVDVAGMALFTVGCALNTGAELQRRRFKKNPANTGRLYTRGAFGVVRHPNYLGDILWLLGWAVLTRHPLALVVPIGVGAAFAWAFAPALSRHLATRYGEEYDAWAARTPALVPGWYRVRRWWRTDPIGLLQRAAGATYLVAGLAKPFGNALAPGVPEDVGEVLRAAAAANAGTPLEGITLALAANAGAVTALVMVAMVALGLTYLADRWLVRAAAVGNVVMLAGFAVILVRHAPWLPPIDATLIGLAVLVYRRADRTRRRDATVPTVGRSSVIDLS